MTRTEWQRRKRARFKAENGYSLSAHYGTGGLRQAVLARDDYKCCVCEMTDAQHKAKWGKPITVDHRDRVRAHNTMENLWTLCLSCHGSKDILPALRAPRLLAFKDRVVAAREAGRSCNSIALELGFGCRVVTKWVRVWRKDDPLCQKQ